MRVPLEFWRSVLALLGLFFAFMLGRAWVAWREDRVKVSRVYGWVIRTTLCALAVAWRRPIDLSVILVWALLAAALAAGVWIESRPPREEEDLTRKMFPDNDKDE